MKRPIQYTIKSMFEENERPLRARIARLRREKEILAIAIQLASREKAELAAAASEILDIIDQGDVSEVWQVALLRMRAALRSATEKGDLPSVNWKDGQPRK